MRVQAGALLFVMLLPSVVMAAGDEAPVVVRALAVAETAQGLVGSVADVSITQRPGTGLLFMDTQPFTQVDMQGSARLAVRVAGSITGIDVEARDFFFVVRSGSQLIGGPSAGGVMTVGAIAALKGWRIEPDVYMTGTIQPDGSVGPVGGIPEKAQAAAERGARLFLYPVGEEVTLARTARGVVRVNMSEHCAGLSITCQAVVDVEDAVEAFTSMRLERALPATPDSDARFREVMGPHAKRQIGEADALLARRRAGRADADGNASAGVLREADARLASAEAELAQARVADTAGRFYAASSRSFAALINLEEVRLLLGLAGATAGDEWAATEMAALDAVVAEALGNASAAAPQGAAHWQAVAAAQQRAAEAGQRATLARRACEAGVAVSCIEGLAYARERARTVNWWLDVGDGLAWGDVVPEARQRERAVEAIEEADQFLTYVRATLAQSSGAGTLLSEANAKSARARDDFEAGLFAAAVFDALEAQVRASVALEGAVFGEDLPAPRLERAFGEAGRAITEARAAGVEPVLAASQLELASNLSSPIEQVAFADLARVVARSYRLFDNGAVRSPRASEFIGDPRATMPAVPAVDAMFMGLVGILVGLALGWVATRRAIGRASRREEARHEHDHVSSDEGEQVAAGGEPRILTPHGGRDLDQHRDDGASPKADEDDRQDLPPSETPKPGA